MRAAPRLKTARTTGIEHRKDVDRQQPFGTENRIFARNTNGSFPESGNYR
ncbi:hypothetical protein SAMN04487974_1108 [Pelagibacterium luteolum]|uniref:Uncharacterized protein n=1 Tax=Pelagibacterium luteolum TaxID=440168 RepID=A0A1G7XMV7_9HYPH|nr:hypothetical protein SAMN04487974_1108 [Pelagibacterium luteolum]